MYYVFSDVHGNLANMQAAVNDWNPDKEKLIILGDLIDRGPNSYQCINLAMNLKEKYGAIILRGNHEEEFTTFLKHIEDRPEFYFYENARSTIESFFPGIRGILQKYTLKYALGDILENHRNEVNFLENLPLYFETKNILFIHAGIDLNLSNWKSGGPNDFLYIRKKFHYANKQFGKKIIFGHTTTNNLNQDGSYDIWQSPNGEKIGIDGGCVFGGQLNVLKIDDDGNIHDKKTY